MSIDPLHQLVHSRRADLMADARRHALGRTAPPRAPRPARLRSGVAGLLFAAARRLEASAATAATPPPSPC
jgi:hypothetical protein